MFKSKVLATTTLGMGLLCLVPSVASAQDLPEPEPTECVAANYGSANNVQILEHDDCWGIRNESCSVTRAFFNPSDNGFKIVSIHLTDGTTTYAPNEGTWEDRLLLTDNPHETQLFASPDYTVATWTNSDYIPEGPLTLNVTVWDLGLLNEQTFTQEIPACETETSTTVTEPPTTITEPPTTVPEPTTTVAPEVTTTVPLPNCEQLGLTNINRDHPQYRADLDNDGDGVACETSQISRTPTSFTGSAGNISQETLPRTGSSTVPLTIIGSTLLVAGVAACVGAKRKLASIQ